MTEPEKEQAKPLADQLAEQAIAKAKEKTAAEREREAGGLRHRALFHEDRPKE